MEPGHVAGYRYGVNRRYGITGTFEGWQMIKFAESMELARLAATEISRNC